MANLQEVIRKLEAGPWMRHVKTILVALALLGLVLGYNWRSFRNFGTQEAMDSAQLARNLTQGKGYATLFVRPLSVYLIKQHNGAAAGNDPAQIKESHPDLANPPVYPIALAGWMRVYSLAFQAADAVRNKLPDVFKKRLPNFNFEMDNPVWQKEKRFWWSPHDLMIAIFNEGLFFMVIGATFFLARRLFDRNVAWLSSLLLLGSEFLWRFSVSGLSTMLLMLIFVGLAWCLVRVEQEGRDPKGTARNLFLFALGAGWLLGLGMLTRYSFGWLILPVSVYLILFGGPRKAALCLLTLAMFLLVVSPWIYRNMKVCGFPFGTATFAILEGSFFPGNQLARSLQPDFASAFGLNRDTLALFFSKLFGNTRSILQNELPKLGGSWLTALFLTGLLLGFRNPGVRRLRYFLMMSLATLVVVQALGRTQLTDDSPELNSENLLVLLVPLVCVFGVALFYLMLDQMNLEALGLRSIVIGAFGFVKVPREQYSARSAATPIVEGVFGLVMVLPMLLTFLPPRSSPVIFPPYHPPAIHRVSSWMTENELMMSDVPWAVSWYGQCQCIWLTRDANDSFYAVNDLLKRVRGLYFTPLTLDAPFASQWIKPGDDGWGNFLLGSIVVRRAFPATFPLREAAPGFLPDHLFLSDHIRWTAETPAKPLGDRPTTTKKSAVPAKAAK